MRHGTDGQAGGRATAVVGGVAVKDGDVITQMLRRKSPGALRLRVDGKRRKEMVDSRRGRLRTRRQVFGAFGEGVIWRCGQPFWRTSLGVGMKLHGAEVIGGRIVAHPPVMHVYIAFSTCYAPLGGLGTLVGLSLQALLLAEVTKQFVSSGHI